MEKRRFSAMLEAKQNEDYPDGNGSSVPPLKGLVNKITNRKVTPLRKFRDKAGGLSSQDPAPAFKIRKDSMDDDFSAMRAGKKHLLSP